MDNIKSLFFMAKNNRWQEFIEFLKKNEDIDVNIRDDSNNYLINYAIIQNIPDAVSILIHRGANLDTTDQDGRSILFIPIKYNYNEILKLLLYFNKINIGILLVDMRDRNGDTPLHYAINFKNKEASQLLLDNGSDVNNTDKNGNNALHLTIYTKDPQMVSLILDNPKININSRTKTGETSLHIASNFQLDSIISLLLSKTADVNLQDYDHEFTPLHYSVTLNNNKISKLLLSSGADPNIQDFLGNTAIHYAIIEDNYEILTHIMKTKPTTNLNIFNIDSNLPIHLLLEKSESIISEHLPLLLPESNLNFQNSNGSTPLHLITQKDLWEQYIPLLSTKKLNIFILNNENKSPLNYIPKPKIQLFLDLTTKSYLHLLKNQTTSGWQHQWENICSKLELSKEDIKILKQQPTTTTKNKDPCYNIIYNKLLKLQTDPPTCNNTSYPTALNKKCIELPSPSQNVEFCTFTGVSLDILIGLIYLTSKHKNKVCSILSTNFMENKELCSYYKSVGIETNNKCEFMNFEIVWIYYKLYLSTDFPTLFKKCQSSSTSDNQKRFTIIPLGIELREGSHANYLIYDNKTQQVERFEPYGSHPPYKFDYKPSQLDNILELKFTEINPKITYIRPQTYMPKIAFQYFDAIESKTKKLGDPNGFCALWSVWYTDLRLTYEDIPRQNLVNQMLKYIKLKNVPFKDIVRNYSTNITQLRDKILETADLTINDWINDNYTKEQMDNIITEITTLILSTNKK